RANQCHGNDRKLCQGQRERSAGWFVRSLNPLKSGFFGNPFFCPFLPRPALSVRSVGTPARHGTDSRDGVAAYSCDAPAPLLAPPCGTSRRAIPSAGAINALRSSTGAKTVRCLCTSARNSSSVASSLNAGLFGSPASFTADNRACRYGATNAASAAACL